MKYDNWLLSVDAYCQEPNGTRSVFHNEAIYHQRAFIYHGDFLGLLYRTLKGEEGCR